jgi:hypothetical protein
MLLSVVFICFLPKYRFLGGISRLLSDRLILIGFFAEYDRPKSRCGPG